MDNYCTKHKKVHTWMMSSSFCSDCEKEISNKPKYKVKAAYGSGVPAPSLDKQQEWENVYGKFEYWDSYHRKNHGSYWIFVKATGISNGHGASAEIPASTYLSIQGKNPNNFIDVIYTYFPIIK